jgi:hypothetical protein
MRTRYAVPLKALGVTAAVGAACVGYAAGYEVRSFRLRRVEVPVLPPGAKPMRVLQVSDIHMVNGQRKKQVWLGGLAALRPDLVINTGDNLSDPEAVPQTLDALGPLLDFPGAYVFGSNDYYGPMPKSPTRYLSAMLSGNHGMNNADGSARRGVVGAVHNPWTELRDGFDAAGWLNLTNQRGQLKVNGLELELTGLDDPHIRRDRYSAVAGGPSRRTATRWCSPGTPTGGSSASPSTGRWSPTATSTGAGPRASPAMRRADGSRTCTSRRAAAPTATPRSASPARRRRRC